MNKLISLSKQIKASHGNYVTKVRNMAPKILSLEDGVVAPLAAIWLTVLVGCLGLVFDVGNVYLHRNVLANSADAAALAGVQELPANPAGAVAVAESYAYFNQAVPGEYQVSVSGDSKSITVQVQRPVDLFFAKVVGYNKGTAQALAIAQVVPIGATTGIVPLSVEKQTFSYGALYTLKEGAGFGETGWYGPLSLGGNGASIYENNLTYGYQGKIAIGDIIETQTGNISNPTKRAIDKRIEQDIEQGGSTWQTVGRSSARVLIVPVIEAVETGSPNQVKKVKVVGFAAFYVEQVRGQGNQNFIDGRFIRLYSTSELDENATDYGFYGARLIK